MAVQPRGAAQADRPERVAKRLGVRTVHLAPPNTVRDEFGTRLFKRMPYGLDRDRGYAFAGRSPLEPPDRYHGYVGTLRQVGLFEPQEGARGADLVGCDEHYESYHNERFRSTVSISPLTLRTRSEVAKLCPRRSTVQDAER
jgi:hypothetical protein